MSSPNPQPSSPPAEDDVIIEKKNIVQKGSIQLWYCDQCGTLIRPPYPAGMADLTARHCSNCVGSVTAKVPTAKVKSAPISEKKIASRDLHVVGNPDGTSNGALPESQRVLHHHHHRPPVASTQPASNNMIWMIGGGVAALLACILFWAISGSSKKTNPSTEVVKNSGSTQPIPDVKPTSGNTTKPILQAPEMKEPDLPLVPLPVPTDAIRTPIPSVAPPVTPPVEKIVPATLALDAFQAELKDSEQKSGKGLYTEALAGLDALQTKAAQAPWWKEQEGAFQKARKQVVSQDEETKSEIDSILQGLGKADKPEVIDALEAQFKKRGTENAAVAATQTVLPAVKDARARLFKQEAVKRKETWLAQLEKAEKALKLKPMGKAQEELQGSVADLEKQLSGVEGIDDVLGERWGALKFDSFSPKDAELSLLQGAIKTRGNLIEQSFDFTAKAAGDAWVMDKNGNRIGDQGWDSKAGLTWKVSGDPWWGDRGRGDAPILKTPFYFRPEAWSIESELWLKEESVPMGKEKSFYGLLVWDGSGKHLRIRLKDVTPANNKDGDLEFSAEGTNINPNEEFYRYRPTQRIANSKINDSAHFQFSCQNGFASAAVSVNGRVAQITRMPVPFNPIYAGLFLFPRDGGSTATMAVKNFKMVGVPDRDRLKELFQQKRTIAITEYKMAAQRAAVDAEFHRGELQGKISADWHKYWTLTTRDAEPVKGMVDHRGRTAYCTHPLEPGKPAMWKRKVKLEAGSKWFLRFEVSSMGDWLLSVLANGKKLIDNRLIAGDWTPIEVDLSSYAGQEVELELWNLNGGGGSWAGEHGFWDRVRLSPKEKEDPANIPNFAFARLTANDWTSGRFYGNFQGKPGRAVWGKRSPEPTMASTFTLPDLPEGDTVLEIFSLKHGGSPFNHQIILNDKEIFTGPEKNSSGGWRKSTYDIPAGLLKTGVNTVKINGMEDTDAYNREPWFMLNELSIKLK